MAVGSTVTGSPGRGAIPLLGVGTGVRIDPDFDRDPDSDPDRHRAPTESLTPALSPVPSSSLAAVRHAASERYMGEPLMSRRHGLDTRQGAAQRLCSGA